ncbi:hypothetical protein M3Y94_00501900 [Aphelenchoides besseyi]|nr:hypothetical protein M3Y94_00501900 [Aphelenchoides besseyi]KAI6217312.1 hypothetical protein M3Y95_01228500 [Aphelenchoides besseyi]
MASIESENELDNSQSEYQAPVHSEVNEDVGNHTCDQCGIVYERRPPLTRHQNAHENTDGYQCSICGVYASGWIERNTHEEQMHNFKRQTEVKSKKIARIRKDQLSDIGNVGFNLVRMQNSATLPPRESDDASESEIVELENDNPTLESRKKICSFCEKEFQFKLSYQNHIEEHEITDGYVCSCCGIQKEDAKERNKHELDDHKFERTGPNSEIKEALKIDESQKENLKELGTNFDQVQSKAVAWIVEAAGLSGLRKRKLDQPTPQSTNDPEDSVPSEISSQSN